MILIAICSEYPHPTPNLEALVNGLKAQGMDAAYLPWKTTPLETFIATDAVLPLCCWDYYDDPGRFLAWIEALEARGARLLNGPMEVPGGQRVVQMIDPSSESAQSSDATTDTTDTTTDTTTTTASAFSPYGPRVRTTPPGPTASEQPMTLRPAHGPATSRPTLLTPTTVRS